MEQSLPLWRSMLFVPANVSKFVDKAHERGADAIILDLEDSVPLAEKVSARAQLADAARSVSANGADVVVRINSTLRLAAADLEAAIDTSVQAICVPKVNGATQLQWISESIEELEVERGLPVGQTRLIALIESTAALARINEIANSTPRLVAMILGPEDFSSSAGMEPAWDGLLYPNQQVVFAARSAGILPLGFVGSIGQYSDLPAFRETICRSRKLGLRGGFCIHPDQVQIMNEAFAPSSDEVQQAKGVLAAYEQALCEKRGSAEYQGKMIDAPVVARAREVLASHDRITASQDPFGYRT
jgi:citrate lyase subunit beta/citryl-CoA lyase